MPKSYVRLSAGRKDMSEETQALCFFAGANSIFVGDTLLTAENPGEDTDAALFAKLGLKPLETRAALGRARQCTRRHERALDALARRGRHRALAAAGWRRLHLQRLSGACHLARAEGRGSRRARARGAHRRRRLAPACAATTASTRRSKPRPPPSSARKAPSSSAGGFMANVALFSTLPQRGDLIVHDALIHASVHDGMRAGKAERCRGAPQRCAGLRGRHRRLARGRAVPARPGSRSRASTAWTATARRSPI